MSRTVRAIRSAGAPFGAGDGFEPIELLHPPVPVVLRSHAIDQILTIDVIDDKTVGQLDRMSVEPAASQSSPIVPGWSTVPTLRVPVVAGPSLSQGSRAALDRCLMRQAGRYYQQEARH